MKQKDRLSVLFYPNLPQSHSALIPLVAKDWAGDQEVDLGLSAC